MSNDKTVERIIAELKAAHEASTQGEWHTVYASVWHSPNFKPSCLFQTWMPAHRRESTKEDEANAAFIVAAHASLPLLIAEIERLQNVVAALLAE